MKITIVRFRVLSKLEIEIPQGFTHIDGVSGSGKSTILNAIEWCLFGVGTKISIEPRLIDGKGKTSVRIEDTNWIIERNLHDKTIAVSCSDGNLKGDAAEQWISDKFGSYKVWKATSYSSQGDLHPLLVSSSDERMKVFEEIASGGSGSVVKIREYLETIKAERKSLSTDIDTYSNRICGLEEALEAIGNPDGSISMTEEEITKEIADLEERHFKAKVLKQEQDKRRKIVAELNLLTPTDGPSLQYLEDPQRWKARADDIEKKLKIDQIPHVFCENLADAKRYVQFREYMLLHNLPEDLDFALKCVRNTARKKTWIQWKTKRDLVKVMDDTEFDALKREAAEQQELTDDYILIDSTLSEFTAACQNHSKYLKNFKISNPQQLLQAALHQEKYNKYCSFVSTSKSLQETTAKLGQLDSQLQSARLEGLSGNCPCCGKFLMMSGDGSFVESTGVEMSADVVKALQKEKTELEKLQARLQLQLEGLPSEVVKKPTTTTTLSVQHLQDAVREYCEAPEGFEKQKEVLNGFRLKGLFGENIPERSNKDYRKLIQQNLKAKKDLANLEATRPDTFDENIPDENYDEDVIVKAIGLRVDYPHPLHLVKGFLDVLKITDDYQRLSKLGTVSPVPVLDIPKLDRILMLRRQVPEVSGDLCNPEELVDRIAFLRKCLLDTTLAEKRSAILRKIAKEKTALASATIELKTFTRLKTIIETERHQALSDAIEYTNIKIANAMSTMFEGRLLGFKFFLDEGISWIVTENGNTFIPKNTLKTLSGGEKVKISLAVMLSMAGSSSFVILDESMSSMGHDDRERCLKCVRENTSCYAIDVCHETSMGSYDKVISM